MKPLLCALALCLTLAPAMAQSEAAPRPVAKAVTLDNGLAVTPLDVSADDVANMLDIKLWRFQIAAPKSGLLVAARLELRKTGEKPNVLDQWSSDAFKASEYTLGLMPLDGHNLKTAKNIRFYQTNRPLDVFPQQAYGTGSTSSDRPSAWLALKATGYRSSPGQVSKDGTISLLKFEADETGKDKSAAELVLVLTTEPNPFDEAPDDTK